VGSSTYFSRNLNVRLSATQRARSYRIAKTVNQQCALYGEHERRRRAVLDESAQQCPLPERRVALMHTFMLFQFMFRKINLATRLFAGIQRVSVFRRVRPFRKSLPLD
jgi:hypothetical protein